jgi:hypothetical protein
MTFSLPPRQPLLKKPRFAGGGEICRQGGLEPHDLYQMRGIGMRDLQPVMTVLNG